MREDHSTSPRMACSRCRRGTPSSSQQEAWPAAEWTPAPSGPSPTRQERAVVSVEVLRERLNLPRGVMGPWVVSLRTSGKKVECGSSCCAPCRASFVLDFLLHSSILLCFFQACIGGAMYTPQKKAGVLPSAHCWHPGTRATTC